MTVARAQLMVPITCPHCGRGRNVRASSTAARTAPGVGRWRWCITCKLLEAADAHMAAYRRIMRKVEERRMRGL